MQDFTFRIRFKLAKGYTIKVDDKSGSVQLSVSGSEKTLHIDSQESSESINKSQSLILKSSGYSSEHNARSAGEKCRDALMITFARLRIGADFGNLSTPRARFTYTNEWLTFLEQESGKRHLQDKHGLMVYESEPESIFMSGNSAGNLEYPWERLEDLFEQITLQEFNLSDSQRLALELFHTSFFENSSNTRFLLLVMAVEALLEPIPRSEVAQAHVENLIKSTEDSELLSQSEKSSLLGSLKWLRQESIGQTGRRLASNYLGDKTYMGKKSSAFFTHCYNIRSSLVHGNKNHQSISKKVGNATSHLEFLVSDLLFAMLTGEIDSQP